MLCVFTVMTASKVVDEGTTKSQQSCTRRIQLMRNQGCGYHHTVKVTCIVYAPIWDIEVVWFQIEIREFLNAYILKGIHNHLADGLLFKIQLVCTHRSMFVYMSWRWLRGCR